MSVEWDEKGGNGSSKQAGYLLKIKLNKASSYLAQHAPLVYLALSVSMLNDVFCLELFPSPANLTPLLYPQPPTYQS